MTETPEQRVERLEELLESTANVLRGMWLDPAIPPHAKSVLMSRAEKIEAAIAEHEQEG